MWALSPTAAIGHVIDMNGEMAAPPQIVNKTYDFRMMEMK
jgi:hypothetical protein